MRETLSRFGKITKPSFSAISKISSDVSLQLLAAVFAFFASRTEIFDGFRPFGIALVIGASDRFGLSATAGYLMSSWRDSGIDSSYLAAAGIVAAVRWIVRVRNRTAITKRSAYIPSLAAAAVTVVTVELSVAGFTDSLDAFNIIGAMCRIIFIGGISYFFNTAFNCQDGGIAVELSPSQRGSTAVTLCIALTVLCEIPIGALSVGHIAAACCVVGFFYAMPYSDSVLYSAAAICAVVFSENEFWFAAVGLTAAGAMTAVTSRKSRPAHAVIFALTAIMFCIFAQNYVYSAVYVAECSVASVIFLLIPIKAVVSDSVLASADGSELTHRLGELSESMRGISEIMDDMGSDDTAKDIAEILSDATEAGCRKCPLMSYCWIKNYDDTASAFSSISSVLRENNRISTADLPQRFRLRCINLSEIVLEINSRYERYEEQSRRRNGLRLLRTNLRRQFVSLSELTDELRQLLSFRNAGTVKSSQIAKISRRMGIYPEQVGCVLDSNGHFLVRIKTFSRLGGEKCEKLRSAVGSVCERTFSPAEITVEGGKSEIVLLEQPRFILKTAVLQRAKEDICGDVCDIFADNAGKLHLLLSDGMGTGSDAAKDGAVCCEFIKKLVKNGLTVARAAELANSSMSLRSDRESACTVDALSFDMFSGRLDIFKAGAAPTFIVHRGRLTTVGGHSMPIGIFDETASVAGNVELSDGDTAVMISDGVMSIGQLMLEKTIAALSSLRPEEICSQLAELLAGEDDMTVIAAKVEEEK